MTTEYLLVYAGEPCHVMRGCTLKDAERHGDETGAHAVVPVVRKSSRAPGADPQPGVEDARDEVGRLRDEVRRLRDEVRRLRAGPPTVWVDAWTSPPLHFVVFAHRPCAVLCCCSLEEAEAYAESTGAWAAVPASRYRLKAR